jgi:ABC-type glycerol-3-phosphate transport system permease component
MTATATRRRGTSVVARTGRGRAGWLVRTVLTVPCLLCSALIVLGVPVLVFAVLQRYFIRGLLGGAVSD